MITQTSLAKRIGCSTSSICEYESGTAARRPGTELACKFSKVMGKRVEWWLTADPQEIAERIRKYREAQRGV
jgi:transcriptional regulator with XRE-family HTH domain